MRLDRRDTLKLLGAGAGASAAAIDLPAQAQDAPVEFRHGVASGDPLMDRLILWTRVTPSAEAAGGAPVTVAWKVAEAPDFARIVARGRTNTGPQRDYTVKVDAEGLKPGREYWYAFEAGEAHSPVGRAKTLPTGHVDELVMAFVTCALYPNGYFNAYDHIAKSERPRSATTRGRAGRRTITRRPRAPSRTARPTPCAPISNGCPSASQRPAWRARPSTAASTSATSPA